MIKKTTIFLNIFLLYACLAPITYAQVDQDLCAFFSNKSNYRQIYFPRWHIIPDDRLDTEESYTSLAANGRRYLIKGENTEESEPIDLYGHNYYAYKTYLWVDSNPTQSQLFLSPEYIPLVSYSRMSDDLSILPLSDDSSELMFNNKNIEEYGHIMDVLNLSLDSLIWKYRDVWYYSIHVDVPPYGRDDDGSQRYSIGFVIFKIRPDMNVELICTSHQYRR